MRSAKQQYIKVDIFIDEAPFNINLSVNSKVHTQHSLIETLFHYFYIVSFPSNFWANGYNLN